MLIVPSFIHARYYFIRQKDDPISKKIPRYWQLYCEKEKFKFVPRHY
jgi:hypothetical protein